MDVACVLAEDDALRDSAGAGVEGDSTGVLSPSSATSSSTTYAQQQ